MGKQFKTFAPVTGQVSRDDALADDISIDKTMEIEAADGLKPRLPLPARSSIQDTPRPNAQSPSQIPRVPASGSRLEIESYPTRKMGAMAAPTKNSPTVTPWPESMPGHLEPGRFHSEHGVSACERTVEQEQRARTWQRQKGQKRRRRRQALLLVVLSCCLGLLALSGGSFWLYQTHQGLSSAAPAAIPTQAQYTIVSPAPSATTTVGTTAIPTITPGANHVVSSKTDSVLSPVPAPWQTSGQLIVVSISAQKLTAYGGGKPVMTSLVTTGMPALFTPQATYHIIGRVTNSMFYSPWPPSSPYYYAPIHVNYGLKLTNSGIYLHDATWRSVFGPGTNVPHKDPVYGEETGSHGCVEVPLQVMRWLYTWAPNNIPVAVIG